MRSVQIKKRIRKKRKMNHSQKLKFLFILINFTYGTITKATERHTQKDSSTSDESCDRQLGIFREALKQRELWALKCKMI